MSDEPDEEGAVFRAPAYAHPHEEFRERECPGVSREEMERELAETEEVVCNGES